MYFELRDGVAYWATHIKDGEYYFEGDVIPEDATKLEQPTQEILERANKLKGKTYSKSEFEKLLSNFQQNELTNILKLRSDIDYLFIMTGVEI
jgi:hypothetical protein